MIESEKRDLFCVLLQILHQFNLVSLHNFPLSTTPPPPFIDFMAHKLRTTELQPANILCKTDASIVAE